MIEKINRTAEILAQARKEGRFRYLNSPEDIQKMVVLNNELGDLKREHMTKQWLSEISASQTFLNA